MGVIGDNPRIFCNGALVSFGIDFQRDFSFPTRGNVPVKLGDRATSAGSHIQNFKRHIPLVLDFKSMFNCFSLFYFLKIELSLIYYCFWPLLVLAHYGICTKEKEREKQQNVG